VAQKPPPKITLVLAGGGAKGFAHLAVLRRLERDRIPVSKIIGTSMGAVIGGLYASGMSTQDIEKVISSLDPSRVALDQVDRTELPHRVRAYQQQYPVDIELGVRNGQLSFARGVSDGQRFLTLLQQLTANVPPNASFDALKIPFRSVATRYRDGELVVFDRGNLSLAIRASMAAPGVFAPVEIGGETYVDGGLVANLAVEVALKEGADVIIASYLGDDEVKDLPAESGNAFTVANQMLTILMRQNERRNIGLLRPQDILVRPQLQGFGFGDFNRSADIVKVGEAAVLAQDLKFSQLAVASANAAAVERVAPNLSFDQREITIRGITVSGNRDVPSAYIEKSLAPLLNTEFVARDVGQALDDLYTTGNFERVNYELIPITGAGYELAVEVNEKPYGPNFFKTSLGFFSESSGVNMYSVGLGYRRPWLTPDGLELNADMRVGSQNQLSASLYQPFGNGWGISGYTGYRSSVLPLYRPDVTDAQRMAQSTVRRAEIGVDLTFDFNKTFTAKVGVSTNQTGVTIDTAGTVSYLQDNGQTITYLLQDASEKFTGLNLQLTADVLDSPSFPTRGYYANLTTSQISVRGNISTNYRFNALWAHSFGPHIINTGIDIAADHIFECDNCAGTGANLAPLFLGGFQAMGAYQFGQLNGDRLLHFQTTYMYLLSDGGVFRQPTYVGLVAEAGDAWLHTRSMSHNYSGTAFIAVDSKIGDIFLGVASGSGNNKNIFLQLGRRFTVW
jgi:NTE family protein